jgi:formate hydrogenlyase subunit 6/NADH:ubiquinone oxidoreductase subunit I
MNTLIRHADVPKFFDHLIKRYEVVGPAKDGDQLTFLPVKEFKEIDFSRQTDFPAKKYFLPSGEEILRYKGAKAEVELVEEPRIMVIRPCDANAILNHDRVFLDEYPDPYYKARRESTILVVFKCTTPYKNCFCTSVGAEDTVNYDLLFVDIGDKYVVKVGTTKGRELIDAKLFTNIIREGKVTLKCKKRIMHLERLGTHFNNKAWKRESKRCLSCNGCIIVCPSCFCFTIHDEPELDLSSGSRTRHWDYCYIKDHTKVAGGYVFREERWKRFRHRIYHQLKWFREKYGRHLCVGCGRCIDICPTGIDMVDIVNDLR